MGLLNHDIELEKDVLSSAILKTEHLYALMDLDQDVFSNEENRVFFSVMKRLFDTGQEMCFASIRTKSNEMGIKVNNDLYVELMQRGHVVNYDYLLKRLRELYFQRSLALNLKDAYNAVINKKLEYNDFVQKVKVIHDEMNQPDPSLSCTMAEMADIDLDTIFHDGRYLKTGIDSIDDNLLGLFLDQLVVIAAPPGHGKTTLMLNIVTNINDGLVFSHEMGREDLYIKLLARFSGVDSQRIELYTCLNNVEIKKILNAKKFVKNSIRMKLYDEPINYFQMINAIHKEVMTRPVKVIGIDYLQLINGIPGNSREEQLTTLTMSLKNIARKYKIPVIALSQLTKDTYKIGKVPTLGDLRGSGAIAQDADVVIFLYDQDGNDHVAIGKGRKAKIGRVKGITFDKPRSHFYSSNFMPEIYYDANLDKEYHANNYLQ